ncbi:hypothetical protein [Alkalihalobacillus deserti]|uniref:hypothetical protein n=1 Tax=Alkalihalobacillus deserti TaxID=2879466 RepID=UPI001D134E8F|nr:hypothetical protein [Alkalihalobacillus deserti]
MFQILDVLMALLMPILLVTLIILIAKWIWNPNGNKSNESVEEIKEQLNRIEGKIDKLHKNQ